MNYFASIATTSVVASQAEASSATNSPSQNHSNHSHRQLTISSSHENTPQLVSGGHGHTGHGHVDTHLQTENKSPKCRRPLPLFFAESVHFSTKKEKEKETPTLLNHLNRPPKPPVKSCPPISRLRPHHHKKEHDGARVISFLHHNESANAPGNVTGDGGGLISKIYDLKKHRSFFDQCFIVEGNLGCGSFGKVYKVKSKEDGKYYAVKKSREKFKGHSDRVRKLEEVAKHEELPEHRNFVKFYRAWEERQRLYIQIELCQMSLSTYAEKHHNIPEEVIWQFLIDLLQAVKHLHDRSLVHMDIKPDNIFISFDGYCKLGDFGLVVDLNEDLKEVQEGDPKYLAPEVLQNSNNISCAADIFSLGMTILELATDLDLPRGGDPWHQLRNGQIPAHLLESLSDDLIQIIRRMIEPDHMKRATVNELLNTPKIIKLIAMNNRKLFYSGVLSNFKNLFSSLYEITVALCCYILGPIAKLSDYLQLNKYIFPSHRSELTTANANSANNKTMNMSLNNHTSTPKRENDIATPLSMLYVDDDLTNNSPHHLHHQQQVLGINDSFTNNTHHLINNNSYLNPLVDDSTSSSFSDQSGEVSMFKSKTEPPMNKAEKIKHYSKMITGTPDSVSPCKTPPWKPNINSFHHHLTDLQTTPTGPTRQKLFFDEENEDENDNHSRPFSKSNQLKQEDT
jgi:membrane-associated tyrosine/threonine-specific cdc2-inhibitory kinase